VLVARWLGVKGYSRVRGLEAGGLGPWGQSRRLMARVLHGLTLSPAGPPAPPPAVSSQGRGGSLTEVEFIDALATDVLGHAVAADAPPPLLSALRSIYGRVDVLGAAAVDFPALTAFLAAAMPGAAAGTPTSYEEVNTHTHTHSAHTHPALIYICIYIYIYIYTYMCVCIA